jgi:hypothetical protein
MRNYISHNMPLRNRQRGVSTLVITILLLVIITLVVLFSTSVGFIEQRTALNENRARIAEQAAETAINLAGETLKANRNLIISKATGGWLDTTAGNAGWVSCFGVADDATIGSRPHPCRIESDSGRRNELYFYTTNGTGDSIATTRFIASTAVGNVGGAASFPSVVDVQAVLCRIDSSVPTPICDNNPDSGNRIAVTFIATASLTNESTTAVIKETWASFTDASPSASVPIIGSGFIKGLGNATVVTNPNAGGYGVPASIWSPNDIGVSGAASGCGTNNNGVGSFSSCQVGEYLKDTPLSGLKTTCATVNNACKCPDTNNTADSNYLSGHSTGGVKREGIDILDVDGDKGALPDIRFFPGVDCAGAPKDDTNDLSDDSLFEYVFNASDVTDSGNEVTKTGCSPTSNCAVNHLVNNLGATVLPNCSSLGPASSGLYYIEGSCDFPNGNIGSPTSAVIIVVEEEARINNNVIYGLVFVRSNDQSAEVRGNGNAKIFGALVVEGDIDITGSIDIVYDNTGVNSDPNTLPSNAKFARVPGSWLDAVEGF